MFERDRIHLQAARARGPSAKATGHAARTLIGGRTGAMARVWWGGHWEASTTAIGGARRPDAR